MPSFCHGVVVRGGFKLVVAGLLALALTPASAADAACGAAYQRMQVGVLPDIFLNHVEMLIVRPGDGGIVGIKPPVPVFPPGNPLPVVISTKTLDHFWTGNLDLPGIGDCNILATTTIPRVGLANTYDGCYPGSLELCRVLMYPAAATVGPAIDEYVVKKWALRLVAGTEAAPDTRGAVYLFGLDCQGDICVPPPCLTQLPMVPGEFKVPPNPACLTFDAKGEGWHSTGPGVGNAYLVGRGNLYIGPRRAPAFTVAASSDTDAVVIDHWIANDNPQAIVLATPRGAHLGDTRYYGVQYDEARRRWTIVAERNGARIPAGSSFSVYVMGNRGPGFLVASATGAERVWIDDPLTNDNPNAAVFVTHLVDEACTKVSGPGKVDDFPPPGVDPGKTGNSEWQCTSGHFPHPLGVAYDATLGRWAIVSEDGTAFLSPVAFNVFVAGLPGNYRSEWWLPDGTPDYAGRLETAGGVVNGERLELPGFGFRDPEGVVLAMHNLTPHPSSLLPGASNLHPAGVEYTGGAWRMRNLDGGIMPVTAFNVVAPLPPR